MKKFLNFLTLLGLLLLIAGFVIRQYETLQHKNYQVAKGTVTEVFMTSLNQTSEVYYFCPKVEFRTPDERNVTYQPACETGMSDYKKGEEVEIYYDPLNPADAYLKGSEIKREWFEPVYSTFLMALGILIILAGVLQALIAKEG